jgi:hypothetical protein
MRPTRTAALAAIVAAPLLAATAATATPAAATATHATDSTAQTTVAPPPPNGPRVYTEAHRVTWKSALQSGVKNYLIRADARIAWTARPKKGVYLQWVRLSSPKCSDFEKDAFQDVWIAGNSRGTQYGNASCPHLYAIADGHKTYTTNRVHIFISLKAGVAHDFDHQVRYVFDICRKGGC